jgi:hypothetical protein
VEGESEPCHRERLRATVEVGVSVSREMRKAEECIVCKIEALCWFATRWA